MLLYACIVGYIGERAWQREGARASVATQDDLSDLARSSISGKR